MTRKYGISFLISANGNARYECTPYCWGLVTTFVTAIGGISMVVAGVSIFYIMMMSVNERIKKNGMASGEPESDRGAQARVRNF